jgi:hypothetical protein
MHGDIIGGTAWQLTTEILASNHPPEPLADFAIFTDPLASVMFLTNYSAFAGIDGQGLIPSEELQQPEVIGRLKRSESILRKLILSLGDAE